jgi:hypothetical protein
MILVEAQGERRISLVTRRTREIAISVGFWQLGCPEVVKLLYGSALPQ